MFSTKKLVWGLLGPFLVVLILVMLILSPTVFAGSSGAPEGCAVTPELLDGQGFSVTGLGFSVTGLGFSVTGLGFSVTGLGFSVTGLGVTPEQAAQEIVDNPITPQWLIERLSEIEGGAGFNSTPVAVLVVDDFSRPPAGDDIGSHGFQVRRVFDDLAAAAEAAVPGLVIDLFDVDISAADTTYNANAIADRIDETVSGLRSGYGHFVINMSFGLIPCETGEITIGDTVIPPFNFFTALEVIRDTLAVESDEKVVNFLECVTNNYDGTYTAHFGYENPNGSPVTIPYSKEVGSKNFLSGGGLTDEILRAATPTYFARPGVVEDHPGRSDAYPNTAFQVVFNGSSLTWNLLGNSVTASRYSPRCQPDPFWEPELKDARDPDPDFEADLNPILECVDEHADGTFTAHFGYENKLGVPFFIPVTGYGSSDSYLSGGGLSAHVLLIKTPRFFGTPDYPGVPEGRSLPFPNSAFQVKFDGTPLEWELYEEEVIASAESQRCAIPQGYGLTQYFTEHLGVPDDLVDDYLRTLFGMMGGDLGRLTDLLQAYLAESATSDGEFAVIPVAASGNFRYLYGNPPTPAPPLSPASARETIAAGATLGNNGPLWRFSHDSNILAPGAGFEFAPDNFGAGTSFASPFLSMVAALWLTYPDACVFDGVRPPLNLDVAGDFVNAMFSFGGPYPLACAKSTDTPVVAIDIWPYNTRNVINQNSTGLVPVAIFSTNTFDARTVDPTTVTLAGAPAVPDQPGGPLTFFWDVNRDGLRDLVLKFRVQDMQLTPEDTEAVLEGETFAGVSIQGVDSVTVIPPSAPQLETAQYPTFRWSSVPSAVCYHIQIDNNADFSSPIQEATVVEATQYNASALPAGQYYWHVRLGGTCVNVPVSPWSQSSRFTVP